jgi:hypothetical protein
VLLFFFFFFPGTGSGYSGQSCEFDINECNQPGACDPLTTCTNTEGDYTCTDCPDYYTGTGKIGCECLQIFVWIFFFQSSNSHWELILRHLGCLWMGCLLSCCWVHSGTKKIFFFLPSSFQSDSFLLFFFSAIKGPRIATIWMRRLLPWIHWKWRRLRWYQWMWKRRRKCSFILLEKLFSELTPCSS